MAVGTYLKRMVRFVLKGAPEQHTTVHVLESAPGNRLAGKNILITGGGRGLGYYIARRCLRDGAKVLIPEGKKIPCAMPAGNWDPIACILSMMPPMWMEFRNCYSRQRVNLAERFTAL